MNYEFVQTLTNSDFRAATKGTGKNIYGGLRAQSLIYLPYFFSLVLIITLFGFGIKSFYIEKIFDRAAIKSISPLIFIGTVIIAYFLWQKIYIPYVSNYLTKKTNLPWKDFDQKISFDAHGISVSIPNINSQYSWAAIDRIIDKYGFTYFYYGQFALTLSWSSFSDSSLRKEFVTKCRIQMEESKTTQ